MTLPAQVAVRAAALPAGWLDVEVARPVLGGGSGARLTQWRGLASADGETLLLGCVATPIPGWVEDMRPAVQARTSTFTASSAEKLVGAPVETHEKDGLLVVQRPAGAEGVRVDVGVARTFVGYDVEQVLTCFAACARSHVSRKEGARACDVSVESATLEGGTAAPPPGLTLGAVTWAVHHPSGTVASAGVFTFFLAGFAVVARRRPRSRI